MTWQPSERVAAYARQLLEERRVRLIHIHPGELDMPTDMYGAVIIGRDDDYQVWFTDTGVQCECYAASGDNEPGPPRCGHAVAAMIAWQEHQR